MSILNFSSLAGLKVVKKFEAGWVGGFQGFLIEVHREFKRSSTGVLREFHVCFKEVSREIEPHLIRLS